MNKTYTPSMNEIDSMITLNIECDFLRSPNIVFSDRYKKAPEENESI